MAEYPESGTIGILTEGNDWQFFRVSEAAEHAAQE